MPISCQLVKNEASKITNFSIQEIIADPHEKSECKHLQGFVRDRTELGGSSDLLSEDDVSTWSGSPASQSIRLLHRAGPAVGIPNIRLT